ncbi:MAG: alpha/beta fold hydrolase, partial [Myxococcota bacterium]
MPEPVPPSLVDRLLRRWSVFRGSTSRDLPTAIGPVHVLSQAGQGELPPVLLVHGFGASALQWAPLARALLPHVRRVTAVDLPGHGFSVRRPDLALDLLRDGLLVALDQLDDGPAVAVGNSLGGAVVVRYVHARPEQVLGAHLISPGGAPMTPEELDEVRRLFRIRSHGEALAFLERLFGHSVGPIRHLLAPGLRRTFGDEALQGVLAGLTDADWLTTEE